MDTCNEVCVLCFQQTREEMKSLQEAFQKQLNEAAEKVEKQQATVSDSLSLFYFFVSSVVLLILLPLEFVSISNNFACKKLVEY